MKRILFFTLLLGVLTRHCYAQSVLSGKVISAQNGEPMVGAQISLKGSGTTTKTNAKGIYVISINKYPDTLMVSYVGYEQQQQALHQNTKIFDFILKESNSLLQEVIVNTGFYELSKERATGSFSHIDNNLINRSVGSNIINRLEGITNGLNFDRRKIEGENVDRKSPTLRVHGVSTIESDENPLIVLDNFPYESDINTINPNDIESVTILRDAAAASIWGARAGNGVIVITTKQGKYNQKPSISFSGNLNIINKPNLFYSQKRLPSVTAMDIEKELFIRKAYPEEDSTPIPPYIELLIKQRERLISDDNFLLEERQMQQMDIRHEASKHLYQNGLNQQSALNVNGGAVNYRYYFSAGNDNIEDHVKGNNSTRLNLSLQNSFIPVKDLELTAGIWYTRQNSAHNGIHLSSLNVNGNPIPSYVSLVDPVGNAASIVHDYRFEYQQRAPSAGLIDWMYRPLDEIRLADKIGKNKEVRLNGGLKYSFLKWFNLHATYQFVQNNATSMDRYTKESYYVRSMVNRFTQANGEKLIPFEGILEGGPQRENNSHSARIQVNYSQKLVKDHEIYSLAGAEIRQQIVETLPGFRLFNYNSEVLTGNADYDFTTYYPTRPNYAERLPGINSLHSIYTDRYLSYFANASDTYKDRYTLSASLRYDASNLFGVRTNQKGVPLWSAGAGWEISRESFYNSNHIPYLRFRVTYGSSGNVNKSVSAFPTAVYNTERVTGLTNARLRSAGNPNLRWEKVKNLNIGFDTRLKTDRLQGGFDYFVKTATDLIGTDIMDPTTGIIDEDGTPMLNKVNYASLQTKGLDIQITSKNLIGEFKWETTAIFNYIVNKITQINIAKNTKAISYLGLDIPVIGQSKDRIYALPWKGLDHNTGQPNIYVDGQLSTDYYGYLDNYNPENLIKAGVTVPPYVGSLRNTVSFKGFQLGTLIAWKAGYVFLRPTMSSGSEWLQNNSLYHMDYFKRWQHPGDELYTNIPAATSDFDLYRSFAHNLSTDMITKGDHIRLQDVNLSYDLRINNVSKSGFHKVRIYCYAKNLGILWRANKNSIDPDYVNAYYPAQRSIAFGIQVNL